MRRLILLAALMSGCSEFPTEPVQAPLQRAELAPLHLASSQTRIAGSYIVALRGNASGAEVAKALGIRTQRVFRGGRGGVGSAFAARLSQTQLDAARRHSDVAWIEENQVMQVTATQGITKGGLWGLDRIDQASLPLSGSYTYTYTGKGVNVYIIDSGVRTTHSQFVIDGVSRAKTVFDFYDGVLPKGDCNGHGTHVAGIIGGKTYGVAKKVNLKSLRVFDCDGSASGVELLAALDWLLQNYKAPAILNMSIGTGMSWIINSYVDALASIGLFPVVAAGNSGDVLSNPDAFSCYRSPGGALMAFTVAASTKADARASFSNWGRCIYLYAPGQSILSAWYTDNSASATLSGTSMAAPHVSGVAALLKQKFGDLSWLDMTSQLLNRAVKNKISGNDPSSLTYGTPNRLLQKGTL